MRKPPLNTGMPAPMARDEQNERFQAPNEVKITSLDGVEHTIKADEAKEEKE